MTRIMNQLSTQNNRGTTKRQYLAVWRAFNKFVIRLQPIPKTWEHRVNLYVAYLVKKGTQSSTIKSYISAIKSVLSDDGYEWNQKKGVLASLTKCCKLINDTVRNRFPIQKGLLELLLFQVERFFKRKNQYYLEMLYKCFFSLAYYGLMRIGELAQSEHVLKAANIHSGDNKQKILLMLYTSKTHGRGSRPQEIRITADPQNYSNFTRQGTKVVRRFSPFEITKEYSRLRGGYRTQNEQFFIFSDGAPVQSKHVRRMLKRLLKGLKLNPKFYNTHSFRIGRATDLDKFGFSIDSIKALGRWRSNTVYNYIRNY